MFLLVEGFQFESTNENKYQLDFNHHASIVKLVYQTDGIF
jgi:hypothetical protein